jgi:hypothetical protein
VVVEVDVTLKLGCNRHSEVLAFPGRARFEPLRWADGRNRIVHFDALRR